MPIRNTKPVRINGVRYPSHKDAAKAFNLPYGTFMKRRRLGISLTLPLRQYAPWGSSKEPYITVNTRDENGKKQPLDVKTAEALMAAGKILHKHFSKHGVK